MNQKIKIILIFLCIVSTLLLAGFIFLFFQIKSLTTETDNLEAEVQVNLKNQEDTGSLKKIISLFSQGEEQINKAIINKENPLEFFNYLDSLEKKSGVSLKVESFNITDVFDESKDKNQSDQKEKTRTHGEFSANLRAEGDWNSIITFLSLLESMPYKISVEQAKIVSSVDEKTKRIRWSLFYSIKGLTK